MRSARPHESTVVVPNKVRVGLHTVDSRQEAGAGVVERRKEISIERQPRAIFPRGPEFQRRRLICSRSQHGKKQRLILNALLGEERLQMFGGQRREALCILNGNIQTRTQDTPLKASNVVESNRNYYIDARKGETLDGFKGGIITSAILSTSRRLESAGVIVRKRRSHCEARCHCLPDSAVEPLAEDSRTDRGMEGQNCHA